MVAPLIRPPFGDEHTPADDAAVPIGRSIELAGRHAPTWADDEIDAWDGATLLPPAEHCVVRFAATEADVTSRELIGLGRQSAVRAPRLGGVLYGRVAPGSSAAFLLATATARTIRAGYHAALAAKQVAGEAVVSRTADELWGPFVAASYRIPRSIAALAWDVCRFDEFWEDLLLRLDLEREARRIRHGYRSPLQRSIRGLSTVGVALAVTERGADRFTVGRRGTRGRRGALPPAPQQLHPLAG